MQIIKRRDHLDWYNHDLKGDKGDSHGMCQCGICKSVNDSEKSARKRDYIKKSIQKEHRVPEVNFKLRTSQAKDVFKINLFQLEDGYLSVFYHLATKCIIIALAMTQLRVKLNAQRKR